MVWLTKSRFMSGLQCELRLWSEVHAPLDVPFADTLPLINGRAVDAVVQRLEPGIVIARGSGMPAAIAATARVLSQGRASILYQPAFRAGNLAVIADVLRIRGTRAELVEIKATVSVKELHLPDAGFQTLVLRAAKMPVDRIAIGHINNTFVLEAPGRYAGLMVEEEVTARVEALLPEIANLAAVFLKLMAAKTPPVIAMGQHCHNPYACPFISRCSAARGRPPDYPIDLLPGNAALVAELASEGFSDLMALPPELLHGEKHRRIHAATLTGKPFFDAAATQSLRALTYPMAYLDFETIGLAVPELPGTRPYQALPFQWSVHVEEGEDAVRHAEYLAVESFGDFAELTRALLNSMPASGPVFAYNASFERSVLQDLAGRVPACAAQLLMIAERLVDLLPITRAAYYHRDMRGSWSIKDVLPTIAAELSYDNLGAVREGGGAQIAWLELRRVDIEPGRSAALRQDLLDYCRRDTWGLVILRRYLRGFPSDE